MRGQEFTSAIQGREAFPNRISFGATHGQRLKVLAEGRVLLSRSDVMALRDLLAEVCLDWAHEDAGGGGD